MNDIEMKQGLVYQSDRTNQWRYSDKDGKEQWIQQVSRYKALEEIKRGQAVSIATKADFEKRNAWEELQSTDTYIVLTDTRYHNRCIGLAEEPASKGDEIHIQSFGAFEYNTDYEQLHTNLEYNPNFSFGDVGKTVYIAYPGPKFEGDSDLGPGFLTTDTDKVYKYYHNIIQIGHLTDAPVKGTNQKLTTIEISIQGDDRGLLEATMFEGVMAEDVELNPLNPIRVFAYGQDSNAKFKYTFKYSPLRDRDHVFSKDDFIFIHRLGGAGAFISFSDDFDPTNVSNDNDFAQLHLPFNFNKENKIFKVNIIGDDITSKDSLDINIQNIAAAFKSAFESFSDVTVETACNNTTTVEQHIAETSDVPYKIDERIATITSNDFSEFTDVYISDSLRERFTGSEVVNHGAKDSRGKIVLADIRVPSRRKIFGIYFGNESKLLKGRTYAFMSKGEIEVPQTNEFEFKLGKDYYLDRLGMLVEKPLLKYGVLAKIATLKQKRRLVINDIGTQRAYRGDFPVGYQKPCPSEVDENGNVNYIAEFGYVACDGNQKLKISEYEVLYKMLLGWYPKSEIDCDDGEYFNIPRIVRETPFDYTDTDGKVVQKMVEVPVEMKCEPDSIFEELNHTAFIRDFQRFDKETTTEIISSESLVGLPVTVSLNVGDVSEQPGPMKSTQVFLNNVYIDINFDSNIINNGYVFIEPKDNIGENISDKGSFQYFASGLNETGVLKFDTVSFLLYKNGMKTGNYPIFDVSFKEVGTDKVFKSFTLDSSLLYTQKSISVTEDFPLGKMVSEQKSIEVPTENEVCATIKPFDISPVSDYGFKDEEYVGLENFDIHLYVDPNENYQGGPHDWKEIHEGFFNFNEANSYGFKWKLEYIKSDPILAPYGKWMLSTDIGDGHGIAYSDGTSTVPIKLTNCYYKLYVARKEKTPRQFDISNIYKRYMTNTIWSDAENKVPFLDKSVTGKAVQIALRNLDDVDSITANKGAKIQFGTKDKKISKFVIGSEGTVFIYADDDTVFETSISELSVNEVRKFIDDYFEESHHWRTIDGVDWEEFYLKTDDDKGRIHGMIPGQGGNINASSLEHIQVATLSNVPVKESENENDYEAHMPESFKSSWTLKEEKGYIPLRSPDETGVMTESHEGKDKYFENGKLIETDIVSMVGTEVENVKNLNLPDTKSDTNRLFKDKVTIGDKSLEIRYVFDIDDEDNQDKATEGECCDIELVKTIGKSESFARLKLGSFTVASLSKLKRIYGEDLRDTEYPTPLAENSVKYDNDTNFFKTTLGSALQAAYEMPLSYWQYNNEKEWYNKTLSVVVERIKDTIENIDNVERDIHTLTNTADYSDNKFNYTKAEIDSIKEYLNATLDTAEKGVNQTSQVGLLLKAAKETQERLLKLESSTFGADAETIPGSKKPVIDTKVDGITSDPTTLGLNRLVRAICLEMYHDANPDNPTASDFIGGGRQPFGEERTSSLSRLDEFDRLFHGHVEQDEDGSIVSNNYLRSIDARTFPYEIGELPIKDSDQVISEIAVITRESISKVKELEMNRYNFNGLIDALYRIVKKVNALTVCISGSENILNGPVELNKIRDRISERETFDTKSLIDFTWKDNSERMLSVVSLDEDD